MTQDDRQFEQDDLRQALRRAFPAEQAPQTLRDRVVAMLQGDEMWTSDREAPEPVRLTQPAGRVASLSNFFLGARRFALAACIAGLLLGAGLFMATQHFAASPEAMLADSGQVPPFVQAALLRHDEMLQAVNSPQTPSGDLIPLPQLRTEIQQRTARAMPEVDVSTQGWQLAGAKRCQKSDGCIAQIFYRRGPQTLSVFVVPPDVQGRSIRVSSASLKQHLVATRQAGDLTICVVGYSPDGKLTPQEVDRLADLIASH